MAQTAMNGTYYVGGGNADFTSIKEAVDSLSLKGVNGPVVIKIHNGNYKNFKLSGNIPGSSDTNTVTFTSVSGIADSVVIGCQDSFAMVLDNVSHLRFTNITFKSEIPVKRMSGAIRMYGYIENVLFSHCNLYADTLGITLYVVFYTPRGNEDSLYLAGYTPGENEDSLYLSGVRFVGNEVRGGYAGFYFLYAGGSTKNCKPTASKRASVRIDSNHFYGGQFFSSVEFSECAHVGSVSYNLIESYAGYGGIHFDGQWVDSVVCNRIHVKSYNGNHVGMELFSVNDRSTYGNDIAPALVANNEIICSGASALGIYTIYAHADILHNSVYCKSPSNCGLNVGPHNNNHQLNIQNNVIMTDGTGSNIFVYAVYDSVFTFYKTLLDNNNYFTTDTNHGYFTCYIGSSTNDMATWQNTYHTDTHSVSVKPDFFNLPYDLNLGNYNDTMKCARNNTVTRDIFGNPRKSLTDMGCYESYDVALFSNDAAMGTVKRKYAGGSTILLYAIPAAYHHFVAWNDGDTSNPRTVAVSGDTSFTAIFAFNPYVLLSVTSNDTVMGNVTAGGKYAYLSQVKISAMPKYGYHFTQWNDGDTNNPRVVTLLGDTSFTASFAVNSYNLAVVSSDTLKGGVTGGGSFAYLSQALIFATPNYGYHFTQWNDGDTSNPRVVTLSGDTSFTASFAPNSYQLVVVSSDDAMGTVEGGNTYSYLDTAVLRATPAEHHHFLHWSNGDTTNPRMVTVLGDSSFTAVFAIDSHRLTVFSNDTAMGHVTGGGYYAYGTEVELTAVAADNHHFVRWDDGDTTNPRMVTVLGDSSFTAVFAIDTHQLTVLSNDTAMGHVTGGGYYAYGTEVELTAVAADNHHFVRWSDGDTTNPRIVTVTGDDTLTAIFEYNIGIREHTLPEGISIYGSDRHIVIKGAEGYEVKILNAIGQLIHRAVINEDVLWVRMPVKGVYFVKVGAFPPKKVLVY